MKFTEAVIGNFGTLGEATIKLSDRGLVLVQGDNNHNSSAESNGAGKSTVFEAISWCFYGKTAKGQTADGVINRRAKKDCFVTTMVEEGDTTYEITRGRKHKVFKSKLHVTRTDSGGKKSVLTKGTDKLTQVLVDQIVGCSYEVFVGAVYAGQEKMPDLPSMSDSNLKVLIEEAAGTTILSEAYTIARQVLSDDKDKLETKQDELDKSDNDVIRARDRLQDAKDSKERWIAERDARIIDSEVKARTLLRDAGALKSQMEMGKSESELNTLRGLNKNKMDMRDAEVLKLEDLEEREGVLNRNAAVYRATAEAGTRSINNLRSDLHELEDHIGKPCTSCKRPHTKESLNSAISAKRKEISILTAQAREDISKYKDTMSEAQTAATAAEDYRSSMTDMREAVAHAEDLSEQLSKVISIKSKYKSTLERAKDYTSSIKEERANENPYDAQIEERKGYLKTCSDRKSDIRAEISPLQAKVDVSTGVVAVYSPKGVRAHILDTVTPYLNARTAHYLGTLTDGEIQAIWQTITLTAKGEARENFKIAVTGDDGEGSFVDLSGGEKRKVRVACSLALQDLVSTRASKPISLFIADEIDDALDTAGLERLMSILEEKAKERGSVFIISHSDLRDWVSTTITVEKSSGISRIKA